MPAAWQRDSWNMRASTAPSRCWAGAGVPRVAAGASIGTPWAVRRRRGLPFDLRSIAEVGVLDAMVIASRIPEVAMSKSKSPQAPRGITQLTISRGEAVQQHDDRIQLGQDMLARPFRDEHDFVARDAEFETWDEYNADMLRRIFSTAEYSEQYTECGVISMRMNPSLAEKAQELAKNIREKCRRLGSIRDRLPIIPEHASVAKTVGARQSERASTSRKVFVVHGHDEALKLDVARFVERLGLEAILLSEQTNQGRTIIEKFEAHAEEVGFAIVLLTPDDIGTSAATPNALKSRARQNVILELGYFIGKLTRSRVCALHKGDVELPSDILGVVYISVSSNWKLQLAGEMKVAWPDLDLNRAH